MTFSEVVELLWETVKSYKPELDTGLLEDIAKGKADLSALSPDDVTEDFAKALLIRGLVENLYHVHKAWSEKSKFEVKEWLKKIGLTAVLTYHPTPFHVHSAWGLNQATRTIVTDGDPASFDSAVRATFKLPMRNEKKPSAKTMGEFVLKVAYLFLMAVSKNRLFKNWSLEGWVEGDMDGNRSRTAVEVLNACFEAKVPRQLRENASVVREVFNSRIGDSDPREAILNIAAAEKDYDSRLEQVLGGVTSSHRLTQAVIADAEEVDDVLKLAAVMKSCGTCLPICPLLERFFRMEQWTVKLRQLLKDPAFEAYAMEVENGKKIVRFQVGPSDTAAHAGFWSLIGIGHLIQELLQVAKEEGWQVVLFVGAGRNRARGGGENLQDLAWTLPNLKGLVRNVQFTVQGGLASSVFMSLKQVQYHLGTLMEALGDKPKHDPARSLALYSFSAKVVKQFEKHANPLRALLMKSPSLDTIDSANLSDRDLSRDQSGLGLRAIAVQQLLALNSAEYLLLLGFLPAWKETSAEDRELLLSTAKFKRAVKFALEANLVSDLESVRLMCVASGYGDTYFAELKMELMESRELLSSLLEEVDREEVLTKSEKKKNQLGIARWVLKVGPNNLSLSARVLLMHYTLVILGRIG